MHVDQTVIRKAGAIHQSGCFCANGDLIGLGDQFKATDSVSIPKSSFAMISVS